jgi:hypothetical protein
MQPIAEEDAIFNDPLAELTGHISDVSLTNHQPKRKKNENSFKNKK